MADLITAIQTTSFGAAVFYMTAGALFFWLFDLIKNDRIEEYCKKYLDD